MPRVLWEEAEHGSVGGIGRGLLLPAASVGRQPFGCNQGFGGLHTHRTLVTFVGVDEATWKLQMDVDVCNRQGPWGQAAALSRSRLNPLGDALGLQG